MGASLRRGLAAAGDTDEVVIMLADQPFLTRGGGRARAGGAGRLGARSLRAARPAIRSCCARALLARAGELHGDRGFRGRLEEATEVECGDLADPRDIDTRADLEVVRR